MKFILKFNDYVAGSSIRNPFSFFITTEDCFCGTAHNYISVLCTDFLGRLLDHTNRTGLNDVQIIFRARF